jgi:hypothetical protein
VRTFDLLQANQGDTGGGRNVHRRHAPFLRFDYITFVIQRTFLNIPMPTFQRDAERPFPGDELVDGRNDILVPAFRRDVQGGQPVANRTSSLGAARSISVTWSVSPVLIVRRRFLVFIMVQKGPTPSHGISLDDGS